ncbi:unnamed protein product [Moneuplotes crassus]|uniref:RING-type domain-containing protein n=1 Tax=Euplotes crassus TaxID=5936 RepID=A0AAD1XDV0_EUPCR|nr:unnamed protein product [Moneuplotes crassus]
MENALCPVCYTNNVTKPSLNCGFKVCSQCLVNWIESKATVEFIPKFSDKFEKEKCQSEHILCINVECEKNLDRNLILQEEKEEHTLGYKECFEFLQEAEDQEALEKFSLLMLNLISINGKDYRKCPKSGCNYIGTIDLKPSRQMLSCEKCGFEWSDPALYPFCKRFLLKFQNFFSYNSDTINNFQKIMKGEPCPNCGICIIKLDGCSHMVCGKCNYEFCWDCLGHYPSYNHTEITFCPIRKVILLVFLLFLILSINTKICLLSELVANFEFLILDWAVFLIVSNAYAALVLVFFELYSEATSNYRLMNEFPEYSLVYRRNFIWYGMLSAAYPIGYISMSVFLYFISDYYNSMLKCLAVEGMIAVIGVLSFIIVYCIFSIFKGVFGQRQQAYEMDQELGDDPEMWSNGRNYEDDQRLDEPFIPKYEDYEEEEEKRPFGKSEYKNIQSKEDDMLELVNVQKEINRFNQVKRSWNNPFEKDPNVRTFGGVSETI